MNQLPTTKCTSCDAKLITSDLKPRELARCGGCGAEFLLGADGESTKRSRKAIASLTLGLLSVAGMCITGIPAIVLGVWALIDIKRSDETLRGQKTAWAGIGLGSVFGLLCTGLVLPGVSMMFLLMHSRTDDPEQIRQIADKICQIQLPAGLEPRRGVDLFSLRTVDFHDSRTGTTVLIEQFAMVGISRHQAETQLRAMRPVRTNYREVNRVTYKVLGDPLEIVIYAGKFGRNSYRRYVGMVSARDGPVSVQVTTPESSESDNSSVEGGGVVLSEADVRALFESIRLTDA